MGAQQTCCTSGRSKVPNSFCDRLGVAFGQEAAPGRPFPEQSPSNRTKGNTLRVLRIMEESRKALRASHPGVQSTQGHCRGTHQEMPPTRLSSTSPQRSQILAHKNKKSNTDSDSEEDDCTISNKRTDREKDDKLITEKAQRRRPQSDPASAKDSRKSETYSERRRQRATSHPGFQPAQDHSRGTHQEMPARFSSPQRSPSLAMKKNNTDSGSGENDCSISNKNNDDNKDNKIITEGLQRLRSQSNPASLNYSRKSESYSERRRQRAATVR